MGAQTSISGKEETQSPQERRGQGARSLQGCWRAGPTAAAISTRMFCSIKKGKSAERTQHQQLRTQAGISVCHYAVLCADIGLLGATLQIRRNAALHSPDSALWYHHIANKQKNITWGLPCFNLFVANCLKSRGVLQKNPNYPKP